MRYRTAGIVSAALVLVDVGMFNLPTVAWPVLLPYMEQPGIDPPIYVKVLYVASASCSTWKWLVAFSTPPIAVVLFVIAAFTRGAGAHKLTTGS